MTFYKRDHKGGLRESLETSKEITREDFELAIKRCNYYGYDERIDQLLWLDMDYTWYCACGNKDKIQEWLNTTYNK